MDSSSATASSATASSVGRWVWVVALLIGALALSTRLAAPWRTDVINDEMHHLQSWRNRYGTDDIYPLFLQRLEASGKLPARRLEQVRKIYHAHPLIQRGLIVLVDPQPPLYPILAEFTQWLTASSLLALRFWSVFFALAAVWVAWRIGRDWLSPAAGLWMALLVCLGATSQFYAGIGRPYALTQLTILLVIWGFIARRRGKLSGGGFLALALLAQSTQWMAWSVVLPLVVADGWLTAKASRRAYGVYAACCALLAGYMGVQLMNPTVSQQGGLRSLGRVAWCYAVAGPFSNLGGLGQPFFIAGGILFAVLVLAAAGFLLRRRDAILTGLCLATLGGLAAAIVIGVEVRFAVSYATPALVLAGFTLHHASLRLGRRAGGVVLAATTLLLGGQMLVWPEDPYARIDTYDVPWSQVAGLIRRDIGPGGRWIAFPANVANNVYRYLPPGFSEPVMPTSRRGLEETLRQTPGVWMLLESPSLVAEGEGWHNIAGRFGWGKRARASLDQVN